MGNQIFSYIKEDNFEKGHEYILSGKSLNIRNKKGETPLQYACRKNKINFVKLFLMYNCDTHDINKNGESALSLALNHLDSEIAYLLTTK